MQRSVPKLKGRNPLQVLKQLSTSDEIDAQTINQEVFSLLSQFSTQQFNIAEFTQDFLQLNDKQNYTNNDIIEFILAQARIRDLYARLNKIQSTMIINALLNSIKKNASHENKGQCIRLIGHLLYEDNEVDNSSLEKIYQVISKLAFDPQQSDKLPPTTAASSGSIGDQGGQPQQISSGGPQSTTLANSSKLQRISLNCIANLFLKPQPMFMKNNAESMFIKLRSVFEQLMRKIQFNYKSKRFISTLTTVIRALQLSMNEVLTNQKYNIGENDCVKLFLHFYKLLFLGSPFAEKMLHIKFEEPKAKSGKALSKQIISMEEEQQSIEEELKSDSGSAFVIDTSDMSSQSDGGSVYGSKSSPNESESGGQGGDHYQKIKNYAVICLQQLFKFNGKTLFNYWYIVFPSYFMKPQSEFTNYLGSFVEKKEEYYEKASQLLKREPTMFYLLQANENNVKLKSTICFTISIMLENQIIQKWQGQLEKDYSQSLHQSQSQQPAFVSMSNVLGQFLRFLHYQLLYMIETEVEQSSNSDQQLLSQLIKTVGTLIHITPYSKMNKGLASILLEPLIRLLQLSSEDSHQSLDLQTKISILNTLSIAFNINDLRDDLEQSIFKPDIIHTLFKYLTSADQDFLGSSQECIQLFQRFAKNYPYHLLDCFEQEQFAEYLNRQLFEGNAYSERKKIVQVFKILEEWAKNFKSQSLVSGGQQAEDDEEEETKESIMDQKGTSEGPYVIESFQKLMNQVIDYYIVNKQNQSTEVCVAILNILNHLDTNQWKSLFTPQTTSQKLLQFIFSANKAPPLLKASCIKMIGYMVYFDMSELLQTREEETQFYNKVYQTIIECSNDTNMNVQVRNSWTLANLCCINKQIYKDDYLAQETLIIALTYASSNKEKISSNGLRALGYYLQMTDISHLKTKVLDFINKSKHQQHRVQGILGLQKALSIDDLIKIIVVNLDSKCPKIAWNACVALTNILDNQTFTGQESIFGKSGVQPLLKALDQSTNYKTKIHAATTLLKFTSSQVFKKDNLLHDAWLSLVNTLQQHNQAIYSTQDQRKYVQTLDNLIFTLWKSIASLTHHQDYQSQLKTFINTHSLHLLQTITDYLTKELKVPKYSEMYDDKELLLQETLAIFSENPTLESKLNQLRVVIITVRNIIKENEDVHVSFGVYESFNSMAEADVKSYRLLECLKVQKASFQPSFDDQSSSSASEV